MVDLMPCRFHLKSSLRRDESGQTLLETGLVLPIVFLMTFALINFSFVLFSMANVNYASRTALRYASTHSLTSYTPVTQPLLNSYVTPYIYSYPRNTFSISVVYSTPGSSIGTNTVGSGVYVTVTISYPFTILGHNYGPLKYSSTGCGIVLQ